MVLSNPGIRFYWWKRFSATGCRYRSYSLPGRNYTVHLVFAHKYRRMGIGWRLFVQQGKPVIADIIPGNALRMADEKIPVAAAEKDNILILG